MIGYINIWLRYQYPKGYLCFNARYPYFWQKKGYFRHFMKKLKIQG